MCFGNVSLYWMHMKEYQLPEEQGHLVSYSEYGNPQGPAILSFHGGPGSGSKPQHAERFDLTKYRVVLFDQRGCGKSTPLGGIEHNTTDDLLRDAERIREALGIDTWFVGGSSWGSTLALLYALKHPERVRGLLLSAIFLADKDTLSWSMSDPKGVAKLMPDVWARRMAFFNKFNVRLENQNEDLLAMLEEGDLETQKEVAAGIHNWEHNLFSVESQVSYKTPEEMTEGNIASAKIFVHYEKHHEFIPENYILDSIETIADIPAVIVHGRYDIVCPIDKAYALQQRMRRSDFVIIPSSGHIPSEEGKVIVKIAFDRFLARLQA